MSHETFSVPARIDTERLTVRRYSHADAQALHDVTLASVEHLLPWMAWAHEEPKTMEQRHELIDFFDVEFDAGRDFTLGIFERASGRYLGGTGFHVRPGALEIGYWIGPDAEGKGFVSETAAALTQVAIAFSGSQRVVIATDPANTRSVAVAERLGYRVYEETEEPAGPGGAMRPTLLWELTAAGFPASPAAAWPRPALFDTFGNEVPWPA